MARYDNVWNMSIAATLIIAVCLCAQFINVDAAAENNGKTSQIFVYYLLIRIFTIFPYICFAFIQHSPAGKLLISR